MARLEASVFLIDFQKQFTMLNTKDGEESESISLGLNWIHGYLLPWTTRGHHWEKTLGWT